MQRPGAGNFSNREGVDTGNDGEKFHNTNRFVSTPPGRQKMFNSRILVKILILLGCLIAASCTSAVDPAVTEPQPGPSEMEEAPEFLLSALNTALEHLRDIQSAEVPAEGVEWSAEPVDLGDLVGKGEYLLKSGSWEAIMSYPVVAPDAMIVSIQLVNRDRGFTWEGKVDAQGEVFELAPDGVLAALVKVALYITDMYDVGFPMDANVWNAKMVDTGLIGAGKYELLIEDWKVKVDYPVVAPDATIYTIEISNESVGFDWIGEVDPAGNVTLISVSGVE